eukprot:Skav209644  [mRNA]  locus=scaffold650:51795:61668:- [translate_table: standard]
MEVRSASKSGLRQLLGDLVTTRTFCSKAVLLIGGYFAVAVAIFSNLEGWTPLDVVYFSIITLMTEMKQARVGVFDSAGQRRRWRRRSCAWIGALLGLLLICSLLSKGMVEDCHTWVDALYFTVVTLSTIGYGDVTAGKERGSRVVVGIVVLFGVPFFGIILARIVEIAYGRAKTHPGLPAVVGGGVGMPTPIETMRFGGEVFS